MSAKIWKIEIKNEIKKKKHYICMLYAGVNAILHQ